MRQLTFFKETKIRTTIIYGWSESPSAHSYGIEKKKVFLENNQTTKNYIEDNCWGTWFPTFSEAKVELLKILQEKKKDLAITTADAKLLKESDAFNLTTGDENG